MRPSFEAAPLRYESLQEGRFREQVATAIAKTLMRGENADLAGGDYVLTSPDGTRYAVRADDSGLVHLVNMETGVSQPLPATANALDALALQEASDVAALDARLAVFEPRRVMRAQRSTSNQTLSAGSATTLLFNNVLNDADAAYDPATGIYTAPDTGNYLVTVSAAITCTNPANSFLGIARSGTLEQLGGLVAYGTNAIFGGASVVLSMGAGQNIRAQVTIPAGVTSPVLAAAAYSRLFIQRLSD